MQPLRYTLTLRLMKDEKCFGPGVVRLMTLISEKGSLRAAAAEMNMAYSKAWRILHTAESQLGFKLITSTTGGRAGGGAVLTPEGSELIERYRLFEEGCRETADRLFTEYFSTY